MNDGLVQCKVRKAVAAQIQCCREVQEEVVAKVAASWATGLVGVSRCDDPKMTRPIYPCAFCALVEGCMPPGRLDGQDVRYSCTRLPGMSPVAGFRAGVRATQ